MPTLNLGRVRFNWRGAYAANTQYLKHDMVTFDGETYACIEDVQGVSPKDATGASHWDIALARGADYNGARDQAIQAAVDAGEARDVAQSHRQAAAASVLQAEEQVDAAEDQVVLATAQADRATSEADRSKAEADRAQTHADAVDPQAISSDYAGDTPPATTWPFKKWADTTNGLLMRRNATDTQWEVERGLFDTPTHQNVLSLNGGPLAGFRNKIINGGFDVWQRAQSFTFSGTPGAYTADRWQIHGMGLATNALTVSHLEGPPVDHTQPSYISKYYGVNIGPAPTGSQGYVHVVQKIEGVQTFAGRKATLSFDLRGSADRELAVELVQDFGVSGSPRAVGIGVTKVAVGVEWQRVQITFDVPSIAGKSVGVGHNLAVVLWLSAGTSYAARTGGLALQDGQFRIANVQFEEGEVATPFEQRPITLEEELCKRYFEAIVSGIMGAGASTNFVGQTYLITPKRVQPTATEVAIIETDNIQGITLGPIYLNSIRIYGRLSVTGTGYRTARVYLDAEL